MARGLDFVRETVVNKCISIFRDGVIIVFAQATFVLHGTLRWIIAIFLSFVASHGIFNYRGTEVVGHIIQGIASISLFNQGFKTLSGVEPGEEEGVQGPVGVWVLILY